MEEDSDLDEDLTRLAGRGDADGGGSGGRKRRSGAVLVRLRADFPQFFSHARPRLP